MPFETTPLQDTRNAFQDLISSQARLSTGQRIQQASDDPSGLIQSERFRAILDEQEAARQNLNVANDLVQTTDAALTEVTSGARNACACEATQQVHACGAAQTWLRGTLIHFALTECSSVAREAVT